MRFTAWWPGRGLHCSRTARVAGPARRGLHTPAAPATHQRARAAPAGHRWSAAGTGARRPTAHGAQECATDRESRCVGGQRGRHACTRAIWRGVPDMSMAMNPHDTSRHCRPSPARSAAGAVGRGRIIQVRVSAAAVVVPAVPCGRVMLWLKCTPFPLFSMLRSPIFQRYSSRSSRTCLHQPVCVCTPKGTVFSAAGPRWVGGTPSL